MKVIPTTETSNQDELLRRAKERAEEKGIAFALALGEIRREDPVLSEACRREVLGWNKDGHRRRIIDSADNLRQLVHARASEKDISYRTALAEIAQENPLLADKAGEQPRPQSTLQDSHVPTSTLKDERAPTSGPDQKSNAEVLRTIALEVAIREKIPYTDALLRVARQNPQLADAARQEVTGAGVHGSPKLAELIHKALRRSEEKGIALVYAIQQIMEEDPALAEASRQGAGMQVKETKEIPGIGTMFICKRAPGGHGPDPLRPKSSTFPAALREVSSKNQELLFQVLAEMTTADCLIDARTRGFVLVLLGTNEVAPWVDFGQCLVTLARRRLKEKRLSFAQALSEVSRDRPSLAILAREQVIRGKPR